MGKMEEESGGGSAYASLPLHKGALGAKIVEKGQEIP